MCSCATVCVVNHLYLPPHTHTILSLFTYSHYRSRARARAFTIAVSNHPTLSVGNRPPAHPPHRDLPTEGEFGQHCRCRVWTSAHAEYLATIEDLLYGRAATEALVRDLMVPPPELYTVANVSNLAHLGPLSDRLASPRRL